MVESTAWRRTNTPAGQGSRCGLTRSAPVPDDLSGDPFGNSERREVRDERDQRIVGGVNERIARGSPAEQHVVDAHLVSQPECEHGYPQHSGLCNDQSFGCAGQTRQTAHRVSKHEY